MTKFADLHIHTHFSDGTMSPQEVVQEAVAVGLCCVGITDHDILEAIEPAQSAAAAFDLEVIPGIELSSEIQGKDVHMLGYLIDTKSEILFNKLEKMQKARIERIKEMIVKLKTQGIKGIDFEEVFALTQSKAVGRLHLATILMQKGFVSCIGEAFQKYLGESCPAYVHKFKVSPYEAIDLIQRAGGIAVMAHPMATNKDELIPSLVEAGLQGIEACYPNFSQTTLNYYQQIANKHGLIATGGSDAHGVGKTNTFIGKAKVPYSVVEELKVRKGSDKFS